jgi:uncharacterized protein
LTTNRAQLVDAVRGFALLGIALVNIHYFAQSSADGWFAANFESLANQAGGFITSSFFLAKFYLLFSFLFGYSSTYLVKGSPENKKRWTKRSFALIGFGFIHAQLLFFGDILFIYGIFGLILWTFMFRRDAVIRGWAVFLYVLTAIGFFFVTVASFLADMFEPLSPEDFLTSSRMDQLMVNGNFLEQVLARSELWITTLPGILILQGPMVFVAFLLGLMAGRNSWLSKQNFKATTANKLMGFGFGFGIPLQMLAAIGLLWTFSGDSFSLGVFMTSLAVIFLTGGLVSAGIIGAIGKLVLSGKKLEILAGAGKHSLSIYLSQSLVFLVIFSGWGLGLFGQTSLLLNLLIGFITWLMLALLATWNARGGRKGPMEALISSSPRS